jgi:type I restriction enzyme R subunit
MRWRTVSGEDVVPKGTPELETVRKGVFEHRRFLDLVKDFIDGGPHPTLLSVHKMTNR